MWLGRVLYTGIILRGEYIYPRLSPQTIFFENTFHMGLEIVILCILGECNFANIGML